MPNTAAPLQSVFGTTDRVVPLVLEDLTDAESRVRARGDAGPSIAWHLGHLLSYRSQAIRLLGQDADNPFETRFGATGATSGDDYPTVSELQRQWADVSGRLHEALGGVSEAALVAPVGAGPHAEQTVQDNLAFVAFHEGFHLGGIAAIQKTLGKQTPAEKIMAAMQANAPSGTSR